jgi:hypothetical protein
MWVSACYYSSEWAASGNHRRIWIILFQKFTAILWVLPHQARPRDFLCLEVGMMLGSARQVCVEPLLAFTLRIHDSIMLCPFHLKNIYAGKSRNSAPSYSFLTEKVREEEARSSAYALIIRSSSKIYSLLDAHKYSTMCKMFFSEKESSNFWLVRVHAALVFISCTYLTFT